MNGKHNQQPFVPEERSRTVRQDILDIVSNGEYTAKDLSKMVSKSEKEVYDHLHHLKKSGDVHMIPARCGRCEYGFEKRDRVTKPSKCPKCKSTTIEPPRFVSGKK